MDDPAGGASRPAIGRQATETVASNPEVNFTAGGVMTVAEAAARIGISESKLYQLVAACRISHYRIGGKIVLTEADLTAYMESCRVAAVTPVATAARPRLSLKHIKLKPAGPGQAGSPAPG